MVPSSQGWAGQIRACSLPDLSSCLAEGRLSLDGAPPTFSPLDLDAIRLSEWAFSRRTSLILCPPDPLSLLPAFIPAALHVASMASQFLRTKVATGSELRIVVATSDYRVRGFYRSLCIRGGPGTLHQPLREVVPAAVLGTAGIRRLGGAAGSTGGWSTLFVRSAADIKTVPDVDLAVIELPGERAEAARDLRVPTIYIAKDPADPLVSRLGETIPVFGWDDRDLAGAAARGKLPPRLACKARGIECEAIPIVNQPICENAAMFWQDVGPLVRLAKGAPLASALSREAYGLFHDLMGLALPTERFEGFSMPVRVRLAAVKEAARHAAGEARDLYLPMVEAELRGIATAIGAAPPKAEALRRLLASHLDARRSVALIVRTAALARAYSDFLEGVRLGDVRVISIGALAGEAPADVAVLTGMAPSWARWIYRSGIAQRVQILCYSPEGSLTSIPGEYDEAGLVRKAIAFQRDYAEWFARPDLKGRTWARLSGESIAISDERAGTPRPGPESVPLGELPAPPEVPPGLWHDGAWFAPVEPGQTRATTVAGADGRGTPAAEVEALRVGLQDGRWALLPVDGVVTRYRTASGETEGGCAVSRLRVGDTIVFLDGDSNKNLLEKVVEVAGEVPALAAAAGWIEHWLSVVRAAHARHGTYEALGSALRNLGCTLQTQSIRLWVIGVTIGPESQDDVRRVGELMGEATLAKGSHNVHRAMRTLRGAHVSLARRLSRLARHVGAAAASGSIEEDEVIDERTGLTAGDFQDSVELGVITTLSPAGKVASIMTGRLQGPGEEVLHG